MSYQKPEQEKHNDALGVAIEADDPVNINNAIEAGGDIHTVVQFGGEKYSGYIPQFISMPQLAIAEAAPHALAHMLHLGLDPHLALTVDSVQKKVGPLGFVTTDKIVINDTPMFIRKKDDETDTVQVNSLTPMAFAARTLEKMKDGNAELPGSFTGEQIEKVKDSIYILLAAGVPAQPELFEKELESSGMVDNELAAFMQEVKNAPAEEKEKLIADQLAKRNIDYFDPEMAATTRGPSESAHGGGGVNAWQAPFEGHLLQ
jgi:hypothetical protein